MNNDNNAGGDWRLLGRLWRFVEPYKRTLALTIVLNVVGVLALLAQPILLQQAIDDAIGQGNLDELFRIVSMFVGVVIVGMGLAHQTSSNSPPCLLTRAFDIPE